MLLVWSGIVLGQVRIELRVEVMSDGYGCDGMVRSKY